MLTQDELKKQVHYDPVTGEFTRIGYYCRWGAFVIRNKKLTETSDDGYIVIRIGGQVYKAHRLVFLYIDNLTLDSNQQVDHINGNRSDNRYINLRISNLQENMKNKSTYKNNSTGVIGVCRFGNRFRARININGKRLSLGLFDTVEEAAIVRQKAEIEFNYHENHGRINES